MAETTYSPYLRRGDVVAFPTNVRKRAVEAHHGRVLSVSPRGVLLMHVLDGKVGNAEWYAWHTLVPAHQKIPKVGMAAARYAAP